MRHEFYHPIETGQKWSESIVLTDGKFSTSPGRADVIFINDDLIAQGYSAVENEVKLSIFDVKNNNFVDLLPLTLSEAYNQYHFKLQFIKPHSILLAHWMGRVDSWKLTDFTPYDWKTLEGKNKHASSLETWGRPIQVSSDGRKIFLSQVFKRDGRADLQELLVNPENAQLSLGEKLTYPEKVFGTEFVAASPDGAMAAIRVGMDRLHLISLSDGHKIDEISPPKKEAQDPGQQPFWNFSSWASFSPDGRFLAFATQRVTQEGFKGSPYKQARFWGAIYLKDFHTGVVTRLFTDPEWLRRQREVTFLEFDSNANLGVGFADGTAVVINKLKIYDGE